METEQPAFYGKPDVGVKWENIYSVVSFSSFSHPSLRLETVRAVVHMRKRDDEVRGEVEGEFSLPTDNHSTVAQRVRSHVTTMSRLLPCVPAPGRCNTSLQHLWSPAHSSGSVWWEADGPEPSPRLQCSSLSPRTPAAEETSPTCTGNDYKQDLDSSPQTFANMRTQCETDTKTPI